MRTKVQLVTATLEFSRRMLSSNTSGLELQGALDSAGGYRSVLGIVKHAASWAHVYHSYAFETPPRHLNQIDWPRGMRDTIEPSQEYVDEVRAWLDDGMQRWVTSVEATAEEALDAPRPCHWGAAAPLFDIVLMVATHWTYHAGEINEILAVRRGHAWEYTEEVEENHISTAGHRLRPEWMSETHATAWEAHLAKRDAELYPG